MGLGRSCSLVLALGLSACAHFDPPAPLLDHVEVYASGKNLASRTTAGVGTAVAGVQVADGPSMIDEFNAARNASFKQQSARGTAGQMLQAGAAVIELRCDLYFRRIGTGARNAGLLTRQIGLLSAALATTLALAGAGQDAIAGVAIGASLATGTAGNFSDAFFFSPDVQSVKELVDKAFARARSELLYGDAQVQTYGDAIAGLRLIQEVCTTHRIRSLVNEAIARGQVVPRYSDELPAPDQAAVERAKRDAGEAAGGVILNDTELLLLFGRVQGNTSDPAFSALFCEQMPAATQTIFCNGASHGAEDRAAARIDRLRLIFADLETARPGLLAQGLGEVLGKLASGGGAMGVAGVGGNARIQVNLSARGSERRAFTLGVD